METQEGENLATMIVVALSSQNVNERKSEDFRDV